MELAMFIYLAELFGGAKFCLGLICGLAAFATIPVYLTSQDFCYSEQEKLAGLKRVKMFIKMALITLVLAIVIPTSKTMYIMAGAYVGQEVITSDATSEIMAKTLKVINAKLDEQLGE